MHGGISATGNLSHYLSRQLRHVADDKTSVVGVVSNLVSGEGTGHIFGGRVPFQRELIAFAFLCGVAFVSPLGFFFVVGKIGGVLNEQLHGIDRVGSVARAGTQAP